MKAIVVGSGPAGVACTQALIARGTNVLMLDVGERIEPENLQHAAALAAHAPEEWRPQDLAFMRQSIQPTAGGVPIKTAYGSTVAYRNGDAGLGLIRENVDVTGSYARGGFSTVWGAAMLPFSANDTQDWPVSIEEMATAYRAVLDFVPLATKRSEMDSAFPLYTETLQPLRMSTQAKKWWAQLSPKASALMQNRLRVAPSRLAVTTTDDRGDCRYCGLCLYGCPYNLIYSAEHTLCALEQSSQFQYRDGISVRKVSETSEGVLVEAPNESFRADRVYLAAGVLSTTKILLESLDAFDTPVEMATSQHFMFPMIRFEGTPDVVRERLHTLAQLFFEIGPSTEFPNTIHLQAYSYNDLYDSVLRRGLGGFFWRLFPKLYEALIGRLFLVQGYLHSKDTGSIRVTLERTPGTQNETQLRLQGNRDPRCRPTIAAALQTLSNARSALRAWPVSAMLKVSPLGQGFHSGGTFPMRAYPNRLETDRWGRPGGWSRIHAVDATVLPSVPATTITLGVMANAYRIGAFSG